MPFFDHISVALPVLAEYDNLPSLLECLRRQTFRNFSLYVCVNQPQEWWQMPVSDWRRQACDDNRRTLCYLSAVNDMSVTVIDCSSLSVAWVGKRRGVGWARKVLADSIVQSASRNEVIVSLDADTSFGDSYLESVLNMFNAHPRCSALAVPYYHPLSSNADMDRAMLRYECYMRHYLLHLLRIASPYAFTALGSAMAFTGEAYKRVGGYTPLQGGEDFYLMQKFAKTGVVMLPYTDELCVYPSGRVSQRVPFGTGPAIALPLTEIEERYPFYAARSFDDVRATYTLFPVLYAADIETPMSDFLRQQLATDDLWQSLRRNFKRQDLFVRACAERVDGLRILQYLKSRPHPDESLIVDGHAIDFAAGAISNLNAVRNSLFSQEMEARQALWRD